jgi:hypothetical protein
MTRHLPNARRARGEDGVALAWALAFLVVVGVVVFYVLGFADTSVQSTTRLSAQRSALYGADGAVNNAIRYVQNNSTAGVFNSASNTCPVVNDNGLNSLNVTVKCVPVTTSGAPTPPSSAPPFAIMTTAPFTRFWNQTTNSPQCSTVSTATGAELGIVQTQNQRPLVVNGDVYDNSDVDADTWSNGCPNTSAAASIQVNGNVIVHESCHDLFAAGGAAPANRWYCGHAANGQTVDDTTGNTGGQTPTGIFSAAPAAMTQNLADPAIADPTGWAPASPAASTPALPTCDPNNLLVKFLPGTYTDAAGLSSLMNGSNPNCKGHLFWFQPGAYYFDFANNSGTWTINDGQARIVGGTPNAIASGAIPVGPVIIAAKNPPAPTTSNPGYTNPANAVALGETPTALSATTGNFTTSNQTRSVTLNGYSISPKIPGGSTALTVNAHIVHSETFSTPSQIASVQLLVRDVNDVNTLCTVPITPSATTGTNTDVTVPIPTSCLDANALNNGFRVRYQITHTNCGGGQPACTNISSSLDGVQFAVSYTAPARAAWNSSDPATVTATSPASPGACIKDGDYGFGPNTGVQFIFGGNSHVILKSGAFELCPSFSDTHQEIVMYGVRSLTSATPRNVSLDPSTAAPVSGTWTPSTNAYQAALRLDGSSVSTSNTGRTTATRQFKLSGYSMPTPIPAGSTNVGVTATVTHAEGSRYDSQQIIVTPHTGTGCTVNVGAPVTCLNADQINSGIDVTYSVRYNCTSILTCGGSQTASLDGIQLVVTYTPPATTGNLDPESGCITKAPYYDLTTHAPAANGACALFQIVADGAGGTAPRVAAFWGTVYAPSAALDVPVDVLSVPVFDRGVVARMLMLGYNVAATAQVPISSTPITANLANNRRMTFTATIPGKSTSVTADVEFCDFGCDSSHPAGSTKVWSWTVTR